MLAHLLTFLHKSLLSLNTNKFFAGIVMLILNLGSKFISVKFSENQEEYLRNNVGRQLLIFAIVFVATKDIYISIALTACFFILTDHLFNENSRFYILPKNFKKMKKAIDDNDDGEISEAELNKAISILTKAKRQRERKNREKAFEMFQNNVRL
jgi:hypothetical protein